MDQNDIKFFKEKILYLEKKNKEYLSKIENFEKKIANNEIQNKLTNAPKIDIKHDHKDWIYTMIIMDNRKIIITGSKDKSIKVLDTMEEDEPILFSIENAHEYEVNYLMKLNENEIISCGGDGKIKKWKINIQYTYEKIQRYKLLETFSFNGTTKVHGSVHKIIKLKNGNLCSCGKDFNIKFWKKNNITGKNEIYKFLKCDGEYVQSILELDDNKLVAGCWHGTQFFDIKTFKAETCIKKTFIQKANALIRMGNKIICSDWGIFFIDIKTQNY